MQQMVMQCFTGLTQVTNTIIAAAEILPVAIIDSVTIADGDFTVDNFTIVA